MVRKGLSSRSCLKDNVYSICYGSENKSHCLKGVFSVHFWPLLLHVAAGFAYVFDWELLAERVIAEQT